jgi:alpha-beta hydrolase superfamily lysophospholipase
MHELDPRNYQPSGLNQQFEGTGLPFSEYVQQTRAMISRARIDLTPDNAEKILNCNSPYEWKPASDTPPNKYKRGILLVHGLYDSAFKMMEIAQYFLKQGFLVRGILLPGHGTVPGDLLNVQYQEWVKAFDYGVETLKKEVEEIYLAGFSLGAALAINYVARYPKVAGLILIAPPLQLRAHNTLKLLTAIRFSDWFSSHFKWYRKVRQQDYVKYESFPYYPAIQIFKLIEESHQLLRQHPLDKLPMFVVVTADDEVLNPDSSIDFFLQYANSHSKMIIYGNKPAAQDTRIIHRKDTYPEQHIIDFSHNCLTSSPENPHYGMNGDYQDFQHYPNCQRPHSDIIYLGAALRKNFTKLPLQRLCYNPDFHQMMTDMDRFISEIRK